VRYGSVKLARHSINTKKMITVPVALFIVLQFPIKLKKSFALFFPKKPEMKICRANFANLARHIWSILGTVPISNTRVLLQSVIWKQNSIFYYYFYNLNSQKATVEKKVTCWLFPAALAILFVKITRVLQSFLKRVSAAKYC